MVENLGMSLCTQASSAARRTGASDPDGSRSLTRARLRDQSAKGMPSDPGPSIARIVDREVAAMASKREALELLLIEEADAWFEYLEATRNQSAPRYGELEPWAWARLSQRLRAIRTRRAKLRPATAA